jgi:hypothetical protein
LVQVDGPKMTETRFQAKRLSAQQYLRKDVSPFEMQQQIARTEFALLQELIKGDSYIGAPVEWEYILRANTLVLPNEIYRQTGKKPFLVPHSKEIAIFSYQQ